MGIIRNIIRLIEEHFIDEHLDEVRQKRKITMHFDTNDKQYYFEDDAVDKMAWWYRIKFFYQPWAFHSLAG